MSSAIGAAKEVVEALQPGDPGHARCLATPPRTTSGSCGKAVRQELRAQDTAPSSTSARALDQLLGGMATVEHALATIRNDLGIGHGKPRLPKDLRPRHAQLAIDVADTYVRYLVATLSDLKLLDGPREPNLSMCHA